MVQAADVIRGNKVNKSSSVSKKFFFEILGLSTLALPANTDTDRIGAQPHLCVYE